MQNTNDYQLNIFNGFCGVIKAEYKNCWDIEFFDLDGNEIVEYPKAKVDSLIPAYCSTVHKCVAAGSFISTKARGLQTIENIRIGDVLAGGGTVSDTVCSGVKDLSRITVLNGMEIEATPEHKFLVKVSALEDIKAENCTELWMTTANIKSCLEHLNVYMTVPHKTDNEAQSTLEPGEAYLLGVLVGDGSYNNAKDYRVEVVRAHDYFSTLAMLFESVWDVQLTKNPKFGSGCGRFYFHNRDVRNHLIDLGLDYVAGADKKIPKSILCGSRKEQIDFIAGLLFTDGSIDAKRGRVCFVTISPHIAMQLQLLLYGLGIKCKRSLTKTNFDTYAWRIEIHGQEDIKAFAATIPVKHFKKREALETYLHAIKSNSTSRLWHWYHKVVSVETVESQITFDLTVEPTHQFTCQGMQVHNSQGSEFKAGVAIVSSSHTWMLSRNLLYTAITRFKEKCVILGDAIALKRAISNTRESERYSKLLERLRD
jgi:hypothetical protein